MICPWRRVEPIPRCALPWRAQPVRGGKSKIFDDSSHAIEFGARRNGISSLEIGRRTKNLPIDDRKDHEEILLYLRVLSSDMPAGLRGQRQQYDRRLHHRGCFGGLGN